MPTVAQRGQAATAQTQQNQTATQSSSNVAMPPTTAHSNQSQTAGIQKVT